MTIRTNVARLHTGVLSLLACAALTSSAGLAQEMSRKDQNSLSAIESITGWTLLFDGESTNGWRGFRADAFPAKGWVVENGELVHKAGGGGGDIVTEREFGDVEFMADFRLAPKANSGIIYRAGEKLDTPWMTGPEFQLIDDAGQGLTSDDWHSSGAMYELFKPNAEKVLKPAGEWNNARIRIHNGYVTHFLNGVKVVDARLFGDDGKATDEWKAVIAASKFKEWPAFGMESKGRLALQDHGDEIAFRNLIVRDLDAKLPNQRDLFNGKDLTGWTAFVPDAQKQNTTPESLWEVKDGVLICKGSLNGYIRTTDKYKNYILKLQWRFSPVTKKAGNSGVLLRMMGEDKVWPKSVEAQLFSENAGDFWSIDDFTMTTDPARTKGRNTKKTKMAERPVGEWNDYEIIVRKGDVILRVNGEEVNQATNVEEVAGYICLQSEGSEIHFKNISLVPLP